MVTHKGTYGKKKKKEKKRDNPQPGKRLVVHMQGDKFEDRDADGWVLVERTSKGR
jgi:hypothetical protein